MSGYESLTQEDLVLMQKYQVFFNYTYNLLQTAPRRHRVFTDEFLRHLVELPLYLYKALKSDQIGRMYEADAGIAHIRTLLKFCPHKNPQRRIISVKQVEQAEILLSEVGGIFGTMLKNHKRYKS